MGRAALIVVVFLLGGCALFKTDEQTKAEVDAKDDAQCQSHGLQPGSLKYDDCRTELADRRTEADRTALSGRLRGVSPWQQ
jgi:hypothetical protein